MLICCCRVRAVQAFATRGNHLPVGGNPPRRRAAPYGPRPTAAHAAWRPAAGPGLHGGTCRDTARM